MTTDPTMMETVADLAFGLEGDAATSQSGGFSDPEQGHTWSVGREAALLVDLAPGSRPTLIEIDVSPYLHAASHSRQRLTLRINGMKVATEAFEQGGTRRYRIPPNVVMRSPLFIEFIQPDTARPSDFGDGVDSRRLGFSFRRLRLLNSKR